MRKIYTALFLMLFAITAKAQFPAPYCAEVFPDGVEPITSVVFNTINNTSSATTGGTAHENFTAISTTVQRSSSYTIQVKGNTDGSYQDGVRVFIDFNNNGVFTDAGESFTVGVLENTTGTDATVVSATIAIPPTATIGSLRMRVSKKYGEYPAPCNVATPTIDNYGQAEDYTVNVIAATSCTGIPNGGGVSPAVSTSCGGRSVTLTSTASNVGSGISYQWQSSAADANNFINISGATLNTYAATPASNTDYRVIITCTGSGLSATSTTATVSSSAIPSNDSVCSAITLTLNGPANCGNTTCATGYGTISTGVAGNPAFTNSTPNNTVWYKFTPAATGVVEFKFKRPAGVTNGLLYGWLGVYTVSDVCPFTFTEIPTFIQYDLTTEDSVQVASPSLTAGTTYYLMVDGFNGATGSFCIQVNAVPPPPTCTTLLSPATGSTNVDNAFTLRWKKVPGAYGYDVYLGGTTPPAYVTSVTDTTVNLGAPAPNSTLYWYVVPNNTGGEANGCNSNISSFSTRVGVINDSCGAPIALTPGISVLGTTVGSSQSRPPGFCSGSLSGKAYDVWYSIKALSNGSFTISVTGFEDFDPVLSIYRGTCSSLTLDTCRDVTFDGGTESITIANAVVGTNYLIRVYSFYNTSDSVSGFVINAIGPSLPVTGIVLSGVRTGSKAQLSWQTLTEINNTGFELQRSADGKYFSSIAQIASKANGGNSTAAITYSAEDAKPFSGANYYRLKQTDKDGKLSYSNIVYLKGAAVSTLTLNSVYPNPTRDVLKAAIQAPAAESIEFVITDMMGKTISRQVSTVISGDNTVNINVANLTSGSYLLKAICRNGCETAYRKFTKQ